MLVFTSTQGYWGLEVTAGLVQRLKDWRLHGARILTRQRLWLSLMQRAGLKYLSPSRPLSQLQLCCALLPTTNSQHSTENLTLVVYAILNI